MKEDFIRLNVSELKAILDSVSGLPEKTQKHIEEQTQVSLNSLYNKIHSAIEFIEENL